MGNNEEDLSIEVKMAEEYKAKIAALEAELINRDKEIEGLRQAISKMPEFAKMDGDVCFKIDQDTARGKHKVCK